MVMMIYVVVVMIFFVVILVLRPRQGGCVGLEGGCGLHEIGKRREKRASRRAVNG